VLIIAFFSPVCIILFSESYGWRRYRWLSTTRQPSPYALGGRLQLSPVGVVDREIERSPDCQAKRPDLSFERVESLFDGDFSQGTSYYTFEVAGGRNLPKNTLGGVEIARRPWFLSGRQRCAPAEGDALPGLQRLLGHDQLATTEIYLNLSPEYVIKKFIDKW